MYPRAKAQANSHLFWLSVCCFEMLLIKGKMLKWINEGFAVNSHNGYLGLPPYNALSIWYLGMLKTYTPVWSNMEKNINKENCSHRKTNTYEKYSSYFYTK